MLHACFCIFLDCAESYCAVFPLGEHCFNRELDHENENLA